MGLSAADFAAPPPGAPSPSATELQALGLRGAKFSPRDRLMLMNSIGMLIGIPTGGWAGGQSRLVEKGDVRLVWLLRRLAQPQVAQLVAQSVGYAARFVSADLMLTVVTAAREHSGSLTAVSMKPIDSFDEGGLDFLWKERHKLGLPASITGLWREVPSFVNPESQHRVYPAKIPERDQVPIYAAQINASFTNNFQGYLREVSRSNVSPGTSPADWSGSRIAMLVWKAYSFLAPGGAPFDQKRPFREQAGQHFGIRSALTYLAGIASSGSVPKRLDQILVNAELNSLEWVRIAKARCAEALFLERLWRTTREIISM
ncbi:MAG: hypothetical protein JWN48_2202 [Myxococcaceae bacterium]|nr:hypothetical protein [Myxococcaceae bacterium]